MGKMYIYRVGSSETRRKSQDLEIWGGNITYNVLTQLISLTEKTPESLY